MSEQQKKGYKPLIRQVLTRRAGDLKYRAAVKKGMDSVTETSAYPYVLPYVEEGRNPQALLRAAALTARHPGLPQAKEPRSLGYALAAMTRKQNGSWPDADRPDVIARRLVGIDRLNMDNAAHTIDTILTYADRTGIAVDYYDLARLLTHWGNGVSPESVHVRRSILNNYYRRAV